MMAAFGPVELIVVKERPRKCGCFLRGRVGDDVD